MLTLDTVPGIDVDNNADRVAILNYNLTYWNSTKIKLLVTWKNPYKLSLSGTPYADKLKVGFILPELFVSVDRLNVLPNNTVISYAVPKQLTQEALIQKKVVEARVENVMDILAGGNLLLNILFAFSLKFLWGFVNML